MEDAIKAAFERQFGSEWSTPVVAPAPDAGEASSDEFEGFTSEPASELEPEAGEGDGATSDEEGPITVKHDELSGGLAETSQPQLTKARRRRFLNGGGAPQDDSIAPAQAPKTAEEHDDLQNDLELQRLIDESHILHERPKGHEFTGADISGIGDPMDLVGKNRLKIMQARLARSGARQSKERMPQAIAVGRRHKAAERASRRREEAREAGIVLARDRHERSASRRRDAGLRINAVGRASEHGIHISAAEVSRVKGQARAAKARRRR